MLTSRKRQSTRPFCENQSVCNSVAVKSTFSMANRMPCSIRNLWCYHGCSQLYFLFVYSTSTLLRLAGLSPGRWLTRRLNTLRWTVRPFSTSASPPSPQTALLRGEAEDSNDRITHTDTDSTLKQLPQTINDVNMSRSYGAWKQAAVSYLLAV